MKTIEELINAKCRMECSIGTAVRSAMLEFEKETGLSPSSIYIHLQSYQMIGERNSKSILESVNSIVDLS